VTIAVFSVSLTASSPRPPSLCARATGPLGKCHPVVIVPTDGFTPWPVTRAREPYRKVGTVLTIGYSVSSTSYFASQCVSIIKTGSVVKVSRLSPIGCSVSSVSYSVFVLCEDRERWL
jgi:hypothetical protein